VFSQLVELAVIDKIRSRFALKLDFQLLWFFERTFSRKLEYSKTKIENFVLKEWKKGVGKNSRCQRYI
jgi:hypothetical protein